MAATSSKHHTGAGTADLIWSDGAKAGLGQAVSKCGHVAGFLYTYTHLQFDIALGLQALDIDNKLTIQLFSFPERSEEYG